MGACAACSPSSNPQAQSPERQSEAEYDLAVDYFHKGNVRVALDHANKAIELDDQNAKALYFTATIYGYFCTGLEGLASPDCKLGEAEKLARRAVEVDGQFRDAKNLLGQILILANKPKEAVEVLRPLVDDPSYSSSYLAWGNLGWAQVQAGDLDAGIASLRNAVTEPRFCVGHYRLGVAFEKKGELAQAEASLTAALGVDSADCRNLQDAWFARGRVRKKLGKIDEATADLAKCREISPSSRTGRECAKMLAPSRL